jgi:methylase of polypeptide subunit release factors
VQSNQLPAGADLVIANPPYMMDAGSRSYRDGGGLLGGAVAADWVTQALASLAPGGAMLLYTGAAVVNGRAPLVVELERLCSEAGAMLDLSEIDPDVFGEELDQPGYGQVERIAAIGAVIKTRR